MFVFSRRIREGVLGGAAKDTIVIEDAAPGSCCYRTVVFPNGREVEAEFVHRGV